MFRALHPTLPQQHSACFFVRGPDCSMQSVRFPSYATQTPAHISGTVSIVRGGRGGAAECPFDEHSVAITRANHHKQNHGAYTILPVARDVYNLIVAAKVPREHIAKDQLT